MTSRPFSIENPQDRFAQLPRRQFLGTFQAERLARREVSVPFAYRPLGLSRRNRVPGQRPVTLTPIRNRSLASSMLTAASRLACWAGPIFWIGYQYWLQVFVSPG